MKTLIAFIDWLDRSMDRIKTVLLLLVIVLFVISLFMNRGSRSRANDLFEKVTGLNLQNDILSLTVSAQNKEILLLQQKYDSIQALEAQTAQDLAALKKHYAILASQRDDLASQLLKTPADSSYRFLNETAYNYPGDKRFPFNEPQVKAIHLTFLEKFSLQQMNTNLQGQIGNYEMQLSLKDNMLATRSQQMELAKSNIQSQESIIENKDEIISVQERELRRRNRGNTFWKSAALVFGGTTAILILSK